MKTKDDDKYARIIDATTALILAQGAAAVSTTQVAKKVGIAQSNIYLYFENKDDLLLQTLTTQQARVQAYFDGRFDSLAPLVAQLHQYIDLLAGFAVAEPGALTVIDQIKQLPGTPAEHPEALFAAPLVTAGIKAGLLRDLPPELHLTVIFNVIRHWAQLKPRPEFAQVHAMIWAAVAK
ncbi:TetR/AcrR family transcriptional regulator [Lacticaseibacillus mingshuiensis]|uniref:TetR/AcrR family transcriptional regulator n=1 Tax=Lacticaseibacillus mingshuiensis TaxID=2799574 RepID=UPI00194F8E10|nr:TetR/AcrR family transcriptional regulator [Lacticaseibacillus mingshuiensis]